MEGLTGSPEVEAEIRRAIVAKLEELNAYVDDELPAYIMVWFFFRLEIKNPQNLSTKVSLYITYYIVIHTKLIIFFLTCNHLLFVVILEGKMSIFLGLENILFVKHLIFCTTTSFYRS